MKKQFLNLMSKAAEKSAKKVGNCASMVGLHEPKMAKKMNNK